MTRPAQTVVVGGGISGLAAAWYLTEPTGDPGDSADSGDAGDTGDVLVLEGSPAVGGKLRLGEVGGVTVDVGAEAMLNRRPEAVDLAREAGFDLVHPGVVSSRVWTCGGLRPLPRSLVGAPLDLDDLAASGVLSAEGLERARREPTLPAEPAGDDVSVGDLVDRRFGPEVTDKLVEPMLGGVYAGHAREISARAAAPQ